ncbi:hypothetical protein GHK33_20230 [Sinorhizobium meliloti]|uniref:hypothetical protein n=1 Tax=Rhizobium meliloti TaxID=382 RepID=UPI001297EC9D|nr:hypothetical protein [Sinorhizobium meliloti]MQW64879.1 hypothetical protein [Sinorhizobium meliloti]
MLQDFDDSGIWQTDRVSAEVQDAGLGMTEQFDCADLQDAAEAEALNPKPPPQLAVADLALFEGREFESRELLALCALRCRSDLGVQKRVVCVQA